MINPEDSRIFGYGFNLDQDNFFVNLNKENKFDRHMVFNSVSVGTVPISLFSSPQHLSGLVNTFPHRRIGSISMTLIKWTFLTQWSAVVLFSSATPDSKPGLL